ncbi:cupin domain-containing protein [Propioniciclava flava]|uniref:Cupin type-2 domain-containing protein n=1 Tax=Propioniciclava flava TaxID=2072026 RepID=A0A4Q2ECV2_9ACTN|nr:cupin domain-containing protein [Propioniciclava flava]RXW31237.1 hypothetical protein C1706_13055 [Propioniciclava flava]
MQIIARSADVEPVTTPEGAQRRLLSYVVSGDLTLLMEGTPDEHLTTGPSYYVPPNVPHGVIIHADTVLVDVFTPQREDFLPA